MSTPKQSNFDLTLEYALSETGTKHELKGSLLVPTPEEMERLGKKEEVAAYAKTIVVGLATKRPPVKCNMNLFDALRLRAKGQ